MAELRWNLASAKNRFLTHQQFLKLTHEFKDVAEKAFDTPCDAVTTIKTKIDATSAQEDTRLVPDLDDVKKQMWKNSSSVSVSITPDSISPQANDRVGGVAQFRGLAADVASFALYGASIEALEKARDTMLALNEKMLAVEAKISRDDPDDTRPTGKSALMQEYKQEQFYKKKIGGEDKPSSPDKNRSPS